MRKVKIIIFLVASFYLLGCKDINIYDEYHESVVMIYHKYLYKATFEGDRLYFNYDETSGNFKNVKQDLKEAEADAMANYGTGFFIGTDGKIATNRHVVFNLTADTENKARTYFQDIANIQKLKNDSLKNNAAFQSNAWTNKYYNSYNQEEMDKALIEINAWKESLNEFSKNVAYWERLQNSLASTKFSVETIYLGYAPDGSFAKRITDFRECQLIRSSKEEEIDLAVIQANEKKLPTATTKFIDLNNISTSPLKVGDEVSMLGYNLGPEISSTTNGLKVQNTSGKVSQESNGIRILYSINALPGSSGSPIFSKNGKLVAINYYGYTKQSFNYGILAKYLAELAKSD